MQAFIPAFAGRAALLLSLLTAANLSAQAQTSQPAPVLEPKVMVHPALVAAAAEPGAVVTATGLVYRQLEAGKGAQPAATDTVRVHYRGSFPDGREFDSSHKRGQPASFPLNRVIRCWTEGVQRMQVGSTARLTCPSDIAYGARGTPDGTIPPNSVLVFEVKLLGITPAAEPGK
jgi:FKBP-type peptidyl-prolyl cis-trans isomerase FkpA